MEFFQSIYEFITADIYVFVQQAFAQAIIWGTTAWFKIKLVAMQFTWGIAREILVQLNVTDFVVSSFSNLPPEVTSFLTKFNIIEGLNSVFNALLTRFIMDRF